MPDDRLFALVGGGAAADAACDQWLQGGRVVIEVVLAEVELLELWEARLEEDLDRQPALHVTRTNGR